MATFPSITPAYSTQETVNQDNNVIELGDGFQQRLVFGLPANKRLINLNLTFNITSTEADTIDTFLDARFDDQASFDFTPPQHSSSLNPCGQQPEVILRKYHEGFHKMLTLA